MNFESSRGERASYGLFFAGQNIIYLLMLQFLALFYTDVVGIGAALVGVLFLVARIWDAVNDPMLGSIVDRAKFKGGKFLPWIKAVNIVLPIATILIFINPHLGAAGNLAYAYVTYIIWGMVYTLCDVPIFALSTAMAKNSNERVIILTWGRVAAMVAGLIIAGAGMPLIQAMGWTQTAVVLSVIAMIVMIPIRFKVIERYIDEDRKPPSVKESFAYIKHHKPMIVFYIALFFTMGTNTILAAGNYFAIYNLGDGEFNYVMPLMMVAFLPMLLMAPMLPPMAGLLVIGAVASILQYLLGYGNVTLVLVLSFIRNAALFTPILLLGMFSSDFVEHGEYHLKTRIEGITFSLQTFMTKLTQALAAGFGSIMLGVWGYVANQTQTSETLNGIFILYTIVPAIGSLIAAFIMWKWYNLKEDDVQRMIDELRSE
jgi:sugar (glycoside-pentoside-hexuronide) transporter